MSFIIGLIIGACAGFIIAGLMVASREQMEREEIERFKKNL